jgi:microcystin-dependent protein
MNLSSLTQITTAKIAPNAITEALINDDVHVNNKVVPVGAVMPFAIDVAVPGRSIPTGWLACSGTTVSRTTYAALFAAIGITFGAGNGSTTFTIPDLRGYFVRGSGTNADGTASGAFGEDQTAYAGANTFSGYVDDGDSQTGSRGGLTELAINSTYLFKTTSARSQNVSVTVATTPGDTRPKNVALLYCIKF